MGLLCGSARPILAQSLGAVIFCISSSHRIRRDRFFTKDASGRRALSMDQEYSRAISRLYLRVVLRRKQSFLLPFPACHRGWLRRLHLCRERSERSKQHPVCAAVFAHRLLDHPVSQSHRRSLWKMGAEHRRAFHLDPGLTFDRPWGHTVPPRRLSNYFYSFQSVSWFRKSGHLECLGADLFRVYRHRAGEHHERRN